MSGWQDGYWRKNSWVWKKDRIYNKQRNEKGTQCAPGKAGFGKGRNIKIHEGPGRDTGLGSGGYLQITRFAIKSNKFQINGDIFLNNLTIYITIFGGMSANFLRYLRFSFSKAVYKRKKDAKLWFYVKYLTILRNSWEEKTSIKQMKNDSKTMPKDNTKAVPETDAETFVK